MNQKETNPLNTPELVSSDVESVSKTEETVPNTNNVKTQNKTKKYLIVFIYLILILSIVGVVIYILLSQYNSSVPNTNVVPTNAGLIPTVSEKSYDSQHSLFLVTNERGTTKTNATVYDVDQNEVLDEINFTLPGDDIRDDYFGIHSSFNVNNDDVYVSTFTNPNQLLGEGEQGICYISYIWGLGCPQSLYKVNMSDSSQQVIYQYKNSFPWILSPDGRMLFIAEIDGANLAIKMIDTQTFEVSTLTTYSDLSDQFKMQINLFNPLFVDDDNKTLYLMLTRNIVDGEKWEEVIRKVDIDTRETTDILLNGINDRFAFHLTISPDAKKIAIGYVDNDSVSKIAIFDLTTKITTHVPNITIGNYNIVWGSTDSLYWENKNQEFSRYDLVSGQLTQLTNIQVDSRNTPLAVSRDKKYLLIKNFNDKLLLYDFEKESISEFLPELNLGIYEIKGVKWL